MLYLQERAEFLELLGIDAWESQRTDPSLQERVLNERTNPG